MLSASRLRAVLKSVSRRQVAGLWVRAVRHDLLLGPPPGELEGAGPQPLWPGGPPQLGARFTPKGGAPSIYLAETAQVALSEVGAVVSVDGGPATAPPFTVLQVEVQLDRVLDLREESVQKLLQTDAQELRGGWRLAAKPPTHRLGAAAVAAGFDGLRVRSAKDSARDVLVVFTENLSRASGSYCEVVEGGALSQRVPPAGDELGG